MSGSFLDSNVLLYLVSDDTAKADTAERVLAEGDTVSVQVLDEIANAARRKMRLAWPDIDDLLEEVAALLQVVPLTIETHRSARAIAARYNLSFYDAAIIAAALGADCTTLFSEDMQHGQHIGTLQVMNPFR
jgi:predicted nucleic acid-binding protein